MQLSRVPDFFFGQPMRARIRVVGDWLKREVSFWRTILILTMRHLFEKPEQKLKK